jgi:hypothetical protein
MYLRIFVFYNVINQKEEQLLGPNLLQCCPLSLQFVMLYSKAKLKSSGDKASTYSRSF